MNFVFRYVLGLNIKIIYHKQEFTDYFGKKLNYSNQTFPTKCINITPSQFLHQKGIQKLEDLPFDIKKIQIPHLNKLTAYDPFSIIFFMISRYEEYLKNETDIHGRFCSSHSIAYKNNYLEFPLVDALIDTIRKALNDIYPEHSIINKPVYHFTPSYDIDHIRAYLWKGLLRTSAASIKDIISFKLATFRERVNVLIGRKKDPYDVFDYLDHIHEQHGLSAIYFWLIGDYGHFDKNPHFTHKNFRRSIHKIAKSNSIGIHPSYRTFLNEQQTQIEIGRLKNISNIPIIKKNRFHFLRFTLPDSYRLLIKLGITDDYSMGYSDRIGYRAGTAHPFYWYDLQHEMCTKLKIHPFQIMDVSLKNHMQLEQQSVIKKVNCLINHTKKYGGHFILLWHNSSFDHKNWYGWKKIFEQIIQSAQDTSTPSS